MRKLGSIAAVAAAVLVVALAAWTRQRAADGQGAATVTGKVKFTGAKPVNPPIDMSEEPKCKAKYPTPPTKEIVVVNPNGTLANVFVYVKAGLPASAKYEAPKTGVVIDQDGCHYRPHVLGIMVAQPLEIKNSDGILHNIKAKGLKNPLQHQPADDDDVDAHVQRARGDGATGVQRARLDAGLPRRPAPSLLRHHGRGRQLHDQGPAARDLHDRGLAREVRDPDRDGHGRGDGEQDAGLHLRRQIGDSVMHWWLPLKGSTFAGEIDGLFLAILIITGIAFVIVEL